MLPKPSEYVTDINLDEVSDDWPTKAEIAESFGGFAYPDIAVDVAYEIEASEPDVGLKGGVSIQTISYNGEDITQYLEGGSTIVDLEQSIAESLEADYYDEGDYNLGLKNGW